VHGLEQIGLLGLGGHAGGGTGSLGIDHNDGKLRGDREAKHFGLERHPGSGARRYTERSGVGGPDRGADRGDLVLRLKSDYAVRLEARQGVEQQRGGRDRVARENHLL
jgi:hypothetical protein